MKADLKDRILAALEQASREQVERYTTTMMYVKDDASASRYGVMTPRIAGLCEVSVSLADVRRVLHGEVDAGRVLLYQGRYRGTLRWWPVGLWETLQQEASDQGGAQ